MTTARPASQTTPDPLRPVTIIGISGATWSVIDPMIAEGALPGFRSLKREGSWGVLRSVRTMGDRHYRPQTAWASLLSGRVPERNGVTTYFHTREDLRAPCAWDFFNARGLSAGLYGGHPLWPPPRIDGFVIPAPYARDDRTWPEDLSFIMDFYRHHQDSKLKPALSRSLAKSLKFVPLLVWGARAPRLVGRLLRSALQLCLERDREVRALTLRSAKLDFSTAVFLALYRSYRPHLAVFTSFEADYVSHRYWRYHEPGRFGEPVGGRSPRLKGAVTEVYSHTDACLRLLLKRLPPHGVVAVVSEHGMAAETATNEIGKWQYLIDGGRVRTRAGLRDDISAVPIARWIVFRRKDGRPLEGTVEGKLKRFTVTETGLPLFTTHAHRGEVIIKLNLKRGDYAEMDDVGALHAEVDGGGPFPVGEILHRVGPTRSAMHAMEGIVLLKGPGIRSDHRIEDAEVTDILPTLLCAAGMNVPPDLDGRVLEVFS